MSYIATPAEERGVDAASAASGSEFSRPMFVDDVVREELVTLVRFILDAVVDVDVVADDLARRHAPYLWENRHRNDLLTINPDATQVDRILTEHRAGMVEQFRTVVGLVRESLLGDNA